MTRVAVHMVLQDYNLLAVCPVSFVFGDKLLNQLENQWKLLTRERCYRKSKRIGGQLNCDTKQQ